MNSPRCHLGYPTQDLVTTTQGNVSWILKFVMQLVHLDNICVFGASIESMLVNIEMMFRQLQGFNLIMKPKNCFFFFQNNIVFLGYVIYM